LEPITAKSYDRPLRKAFGISLAINSLMGIAGAIGNASGLSAFSYVSTAIAAPTALLVGRILKPKGQSFGEIALAGVEALAFSIVFYTLAVWIVLRLWPHLRPAKPNDDSR
jgi:hypothetical protein